MTVRWPALLFISTCIYYGRDYYCNKVGRDMNAFILAYFTAARKTPSQRDTNRPVEMGTRGGPV